MPNGPDRNAWIDYLRSFVTVLVVAHHAALAYTTFAYFEETAYILSTHAVVDKQRWIGLDIFVGFNDIFFMSLLFLVGGLFLSPSVNRKGTAAFIRDRLYRLFIPFILGGTLLMLLAYYPSYYLATGSTNVTGYVKDFFAVEQWPVGPPWFIWVLFVFNLLYAMVHPLLQRCKGGIQQLMNFLQHRPFLFFAGLLLFTWILYVPLAYRVGAGTWTGWWPFDFQLSRILLYFGYFMLGAVIGMTDFNGQLFSRTGSIVKKWWLWIALSLLLYAGLTLVVEKKILERLVTQHTISELSGWMIYFTIYTACCTASCLAFITVFRKWCTRRLGWWDSLSTHAYLIYLLHFVFTTGIQFLLLDRNMPAAGKFCITFIGSLALSWLLAFGLRKIPLFKKYL